MKARRAACPLLEQRGPALPRPCAAMYEPMQGCAQLAMHASKQHVWGPSAPSQRVCPSVDPPGHSSPCKLEFLYKDRTRGPATRGMGSESQRRNQEGEQRYANIKT